MGRHGLPRDRCQCSTRVVCNATGVGKLVREQGQVGPEAASAQIQVRRQPQSRWPGQPKCPSLASRARMQAKPSFRFRQRYNQSRQKPSASDAAASSLAPSQPIITTSVAPISVKDTFVRISGQARLWVARNSARHREAILTTIIRCFERSFAPGGGGLLGVGPW